VGLGLEAAGSDIRYPDLNRSKPLAAQALAVGSDLLSRGLGLLGHAGTLLKRVTCNVLVAGGDRQPLERIAVGQTSPLIRIGTGNGFAVLYNEAYMDSSSLLVKAE
jgi:hypothetical protein